MLATVWASKFMAQWLSGFFPDGAKKIQPWSISVPTLFSTVYSTLRRWNSFFFSATSLDDVSRCGTPIFAFMPHTSYYFRDTFFRDKMHNLWLHQVRLVSTNYSRTLQRRCDGGWVRDTWQQPRTQWWSFWGEVSCFSGRSNGRQWVLRCGMVFPFLLWVISMAACETRVGAEKRKGCFHCSQYWRVFAVLGVEVWLSPKDAF